MPNDAMEWTSPDNEAFAALSGDFNPLHTDEITARRSLFGARIAHGVAVALWALENTPAAHGACPQSLTLNFDAPVRAGDHLRVHARTREQLAVTHAGQDIVRIALTGAMPAIHSHVPASARHGAGECVALTPEEARNREGCEPLWLEPNGALARYPRLLAAWGHAPVAGLLALTRIVGMRCPGARALFLQATIGFQDTAATFLPWRVRKVHPVTGRVMIDVGPGIVSGTLVAAFRPEPVAQPAYASLLDAVAQNEFYGWNALVAGGSRGLGELAAKLVAAGGGEVTVTGRRLDDARRVADEITRGGGRATARAMDVTNPCAHATPHTHLLYFATPPIRANNAPATFETDHTRYAALYVDAFATLVRSLCDSLRGVFYPSSIYVSDAPAGLEVYAAAKAAGELHCEALSGEYPGIRFHAPRLPRLATDQTASVLPSAFEDAVPVMVEALRALKEK